MAGTLAPTPNYIGLDANGAALPAGLLYTYSAGTSTPEATYSDVNLTVANANPIVLNAAGLATVFLSPTSYKFVLKTSAGVTVRTQDNIDAVPATNVDLDINGTAGEVLAAGEVVYLSAGSGGKTAGKWYLADADNTYSSTIAKVVGFAVNAYAADETALIRIQGRITGLSGLTAGTTYYISATAGAVTSSAPSNARAVLVADTTTSGVMSFWIVTQDASATTAGQVNLTTQTLGAGTKTVDALVVTGALTGSGGVTAKVGGGTATAKTSGVVSWNATAVGNVGAGEDDLMTYTLPAATLDGTNAYAVRVTVSGTFSAQAVTKRIRCYFGTTVVLETTTAASATTTRFSAVMTVTRLTATTQAGIGWIQARDGGIPTDNYDSANPGETLANAIVIKMTGTATNNDDIIQTSMLVEVL